ncbi:uncharacterized protein LOC129947859 isoform X1 [Eupeodes corollae]|uniref:uncharacterized protein LOC129947859 isoform X1 n=1 Tax=Eupeodes corollae TaxID=290404 RepID=UPI002490FD00|nr:uncharacterized protein LOC129947859 isoform X1 [Eupeodes corollae]
MLDTLIYIPTVLAYTFISLLISILCFIVVYVSHKVYLSIYDILPVTPANSNQDLYKSKSPPAALRIYIWIGRSRLALLVLEPAVAPGTHLLKYTESISSIPWNEHTKSNNISYVNYSSYTTGTRNSSLQENCNLCMTSH